MPGRCCCCSPRLSRPGLEGSRTLWGVVSSWAAGRTGFCSCSGAGRGREQDCELCLESRSGPGLPAALRGSLPTLHTHPEACPGSQLRAPHHPPRSTPQSPGAAGDPEGRLRGFREQHLRAPLRPPGHRVPSAAPCGALRRRLGA
ncbi:hypothetical protein NDU88_004431 [Pleurodeles waltl]|uniref:Uncharacterized protein n=1 Tax=Pleurodeles waltl TaxID=8319 RepID=A0AAV7VH33_PLEWA|nr:hypothetical protein NDU88_004431 [Pleurodeles waltl]